MHGVNDYLPLLSARFNQPSNLGGRKNNSVYNQRLVHREVDSLAMNFDVLVQ